MESGISPVSLVKIKNHNEFYEEFTLTVLLYPNFLTLSKK